MSLCYTVSSNQLAEGDVYAIEPVSSLAEFLKPEHSLCIVKEPYEGSIVEMTRLEGHDRNGRPLRVRMEQDFRDNQGYTKCKLDKILRSSFLFISWKAKGYHTFRLVKQRETLAEFPDLEAALAAYFPDGFTPERSYRRKCSVFQLMCKAMERRARFRDLATVLSMRTAQLG